MLFRSNGHLYYVRAKTGAVIDIPMSCDVKEIIERRKGNGYLFDVYEKLGTYDKKYNRKKAVNDRCNQLLNLISAELGLGFVLNFSVARRTCITRWMRESNNNYVLVSKKAGTSPEYINKHYYNVDEAMIDEIITNRTLKRA